MVLTLAKKFLFSRALSKDKEEAAECREEKRLDVLCFMLFINLSISGPGHFLDATSHFLLPIPSRVNHCLGGSVEQADLAGGCRQHRWEVHARFVDDHGLAFAEDDLGCFDHLEYTLNNNNNNNNNNSNSNNNYNGCHSEAILFCGILCLRNLSGSSLP